MKAEPKQAGWAFGLLWVVASAIGIFLGFIAAFSIGTFVSDTMGNIATGVFAGMVLGTGVGMMQWLVLRRRVTKAGWWIPASAFGGLVLIAAGSGSYLIPKESLSGALAATGILVAGGPLMGALQWLVLRNKVGRAGWWIVASTAGWGFIILMVRTTPFGGGDGGAVLAIVAGVTFLASITGGVMVWLLRHSDPIAQSKCTSPAPGSVPDC